MKITKKLNQEIQVNHSTQKKKRKKKKVDLSMKNLSAFENMEKILDSVLSQTIQARPIRLF